MVRSAHWQGEAGMRGFVSSRVPVGPGGLVEGRAAVQARVLIRAFSRRGSRRERKQCNPRVRQSGKMPDTCGKGHPNSVKQSPGSPEEP